jgi:hypothetical protein
MEYCGPQGIPHSVFLSWADSDQDKALAWIAHDRGKCPYCGTFPDEWIGPDGMSLEPPPYGVSAVRCYGCVALKDERDLLPEDDTGFITIFTEP